MEKYVTEERFEGAMKHLDSRFGVIENRFDEAMRRIDTRFDEVVTFLKRLDQERIFTIEWVRRIESDVNRIKGHLNIA